MKILLKYCKIKSINRDLFQYCKMVTAKKRESESNASLFRRFSRRVKEARLVAAASEHRFYKESPSRAQKKKDALRKIAYAKKMGELRKLGKDV